ncbi:hypothetical protein E2C01_046995 [Portunus trituberculatus]|uniref:Uncharacterized protein n=1 Tax=Portunus trituberculatus TaxID=210409 RepID=A0A5B7FZ85_PORTR|nr:hypothetical protein [Portunus trituberculatus]
MGVVQVVSRVTRLRGRLFGSTSGRNDGGDPEHPTLWSLEFKNIPAEEHNVCFLRVKHLYALWAPTTIVAPPCPNVRPSSNIFPPTYNLQKRIISTRFA